VIKTSYREFDVPYSEETIREAVSLLQEEAAIEGDGSCRAIRKKSGVTGCVVTPLTINTAHLLIYLAMGSAGLPVFVSETRSIYRYTLDLLPTEDSDLFDLIQDRQGERKVFESCRVQGFELRFEREQAIKLKLDISGDRAAVVYPYLDIFPRESGERFFGDNVKYRINERDFSNIYGLTIQSKKEGGTRTEIWIRRSLEKGSDIPDVIEEMTITAILQKDKYEYRHFGQFRITLKRLVLVSDETDVNSSGAVIGPLRYYVSGSIFAEVFTSTGEKIA
jgi:transposase-like protein